MPTSSFYSTVSRAAAILAGVAVLAGCAHPPRTDSSRIGPFFTPANFVGDPHLGSIRRVVLLPVWAGPHVSPESAAALDEVFALALQKEKRFEVVQFTREQARRRYRVEALSSAGVMPHDLFATLQREFEADAVLFVDLTALEAYKPLALALRSKLAAIDGSRLVWSFDNVFSAEDPALANSARRFFLDRETGVPADLTLSVLQSPRQLATYAAAAMFSTLPPVAPAPLLAGHMK
jgi:hypothetical protein